MIRNKQGITLLETIIYIGLLAIILPLSVTFLINIRNIQQRNINEWRVEDTSSLLLSELKIELSEATAIDISNSSLDSEFSSLVYQDRNNDTFTLQVENDSFLIHNETHDINRLRKVGDSSQWLTPDQINITRWGIEPIRDEYRGTLTGLRLMIEISPYNQATQQDDPTPLITTIYLTPAVQEL